MVAYLALFVAIGGSAYAAQQLPKNSVGSPQIKKNAVKTGDIARNAVKVGKLAKEAVKAGKLAKNAVPTNRLRDNAVSAAKIGSAAVSTEKIAPDAVTGAQVNESTLGEVPKATDAQTLQGIDSSAFPRAARAFVEDTALYQESGTATELDFAAPRNGFLLIVASADVGANDIRDEYNCLIVVDGDEIPVSRRTSEVAPGLVNEEENCGTNTLASVSAGPHNVKFDFESIEGETVVDETELDVVFIPFAG